MCVRTNVCTCVCMCVSVCVCVCVYVCMYLCMCICICLCVCVCTTFSLSADGHLDCCVVLAVVSNAAVIMGMQTFL